MSFTETPEQVALRSAVAQLGATYGYDYMVTKARAHGDMTELYREAGKLGYLGVNLPEEYDGGGQGMYELAIVEEELGAAGCPLLMMVVSPAICAFANGLSRYALDKATAYAKERTVWRDKPIGSHQGVAHPLAQAHIEVELARLMMQKAATLYDQGDHMGAGEAANIAKYAAGEAGVRAVDQAVQTLGGSGLASESSLGALIAMSRVMRIAPVSREMILNFVAQHSLGLPKSY
jgi:alkylation response protein AidB-like acyl-CoA dehydrogenase